jgi:NCAIR mutase (PurE)-related protein
MNKEDIKKLLEDIKNNKTSIEQGMEKLKTLPFEDMGFAKVDHHRSIRTGFPEVIYSPGKTNEQIKEIFKKLIAKGNNIMASRATPENYKFIKKEFKDITYYEEARIIHVKMKETEKTGKKVAIVCAGTSDIPVAEEAAVTAELFGSDVDRIYDVGVAGIHRLLPNIERLRKVNVLIVVAGMEGALASVVGGLVDKPVIAVPTSIGYGANFGGLSALLCMLNSCAT